MIGIYKITNLINKKVYIGCSNNIRNRWNHHLSCLRNNKHNNPLLQRSWNKYGEENFLFDIVELLSDETKLNEKEGYWIDFCDSFNHNKGFNILQVSERKRVIPFTDETRRKISESKKGVKFTEEHKNKLSQIKLGTKRTEETKLKIKNKMIGREFSKETRIKLSLANTGKKHSEETKRKLSELNRGQGLGRKLSKETKQKLSMANLGKRHTKETLRKLSKAKIGSIGNNRKITDSQIELIRNLLNSGVSGVKISKQVGVTTGTVSNIKNMKLRPTYEVYKNV